MLVALGLGLSLDSFRVSLGLGAAHLRHRRRHQLVVAFGLGDGVAPLIGLALGRSLIHALGPWFAAAGPVMVGLYGVAILALVTRYGADVDRYDRAIILGLPPACSLDNLAAGVALGSLGFPVLASAAFLGALSSLMACAGFVLATVATKRLRLGAGLVGGIALLAAAVSLAL
ncbi:MAG TPA: manganese efflux pump [Actinomycetota bacterium]|nr:manganese efflux pump [Actinomycetota bacterium]